MNWHNVLLRPQNLYEELLRRKLISGGGVPAVLQTVTGVSPLTLLNVARKGIKSLKQFGKCEQASTPTPSSPVDIKCNNGALKMVDDELPTGYKRVLGFKMNNNSYWEIADFPLYGSDTLRFSFDATDGCNVIGAYSGSASGNNYSLYVSTSSNYLRYKSGAYNSAIDYDKRYDVELTPTGSSGMKVDSTWTEQTFTTPTNLCIGTTAKSASSAKLKGNLYGNIEVVGRAKFVPCERVSDNALGYYDTIGEAFYEQASGFSGAVSLGYDGSHYFLAVNGTPEVLSVKHIEQTDIYTTVDGRGTYVTPITDVSTRIYKRLPLGAGRYTITVPAAYDFIVQYRKPADNSITPQDYGNYGSWTNGSETVTFDKADTYGYGISLRLHSSPTSTIDTTDFAGEIKIKHWTGQTASVVNLLGVGDYKDEQNIVSGGVTHKVGVKVFDGTENWTRTANGSGVTVFSVDVNAHSIQGWSKITSLCTNFECYVGDTSPTYIAANAGKFWLNTVGQYFRFVTDGTMDLVQFKAYLAAQYANGTPVIVVYPLAEPTTEQVTAQHLTARDTATITAQTNNISDITLEVQYWENAE